MKKYLILLTITYIINLSNFILNKEIKSDSNQIKKSNNLRKRNSKMKEIPADNLNLVQLSNYFYINENGEIIPCPGNHKEDLIRDILSQIKFNLHLKIDGKNDEKTNHKNNKEQVYKLSIDGEQFINQEFKEFKGDNFEIISKSEKTSN